MLVSENSSCECYKVIKLILEATIIDFFVDIFNFHATLMKSVLPLWNINLECLDFAHSHFSAIIPWDPNGVIIY